MHPGDFIKRFLQYAKRHGFRATLVRMGLACKRMHAGNRHVLFYCDPVNCKPVAPEDLNHAKVERKNAESELNGQDRLQIANVWNPQIARRQIAGRFEQGASLWLFKRDDKLAAYGWSMIGRTVEPHFFHLGANDAHLFDFFVFTEHRGRRINPILVNHILTVLASEMRSRAFIEAAEWNSAQLSSLSKTPFKRFGLASKHSIFGKTLVVWSREELKHAR
jgi:ribosomal protein S18 acetylase RimI-like enzyme